MRSIISVIFIFLTWYCNAKKDPVTSGFPHLVNLKSTPVPIASSQLGEVVDIEIMDSLLILNEMFSDKIFKLFNPYRGKLIGSYIHKGKGPLEVVYPCRIHIRSNNTFAQFDRGLKQLDLFSIIKDKIPSVKFSSKFQIKLNQFEVYPVNDSILLCTGVFENGRYCIYNLNSSKQTVSEQYPEYKVTSRFNDLNKAMVYQPSITIKPDKKQFVSFEGRVAYFEIINIEHLTTKRIIAKSYFEPSLCVVNGQATFQKNNPFTYHSPTSTNKYIYVIYAGKSREEFGSECYAGDNLLVYDWSGNPIVNYKLDRSLKIMTLDQEKMQVYGFCTNPTTGEPEIIKYQLPNEIIR
jgi:hypothetical protein